MEVKVWGARGSTPLSSMEMQVFGGNTACLEVLGVGLPGNTFLLFDAGTGLRRFGTTLPDSGLVHIFLTHVHLDHIWGLPFFSPLFSKKWHIKLYVPDVNRNFLQELMNGHFFPVKKQDLESSIEIIPLQDEDIIFFPEFSVQCVPVPHPGVCLGYKMTRHGRSFCYIPDYEVITQEDHARLLAFLRGSSLAVMDSQYFDAEYPSHKGWGHSTPGMSTKLAEAAGVENVLLFHHEPGRTDQDLMGLEQHERERPFCFAREGFTYSLHTLPLSPE